MCLNRPILFSNFIWFFIGGRSSVGRAPDCDSGCRGFNPRRSPHLTPPCFIPLDLNSRKCTTNDFNKLRHFGSSLRYKKLHFVTGFGWIWLDAGWMEKNESLSSKGFHAIFESKRKLKAKVLAGLRPTKRSITTPIAFDGSCFLIRRSLVHVFKGLGQGSARLILLTTHSQRVRAGGQQGGPLEGTFKESADQRATFLRNNIYFFIIYYRWMGWAWINQATSHPSIALANGVYFLNPSIRQ